MGAKHADGHLPRLATFVLFPCVGNQHQLVLLWRCVVLQVFTEEGLIYMVQEYGEIDLARLLAKHDAARREAGNLRDNIDENFIRLYWQQMLQVRTA